MKHNLIHLPFVEIPVLEGFKFPTNFGFHPPLLASLVNKPSIMLNLNPLEQLVQHPACNLSAVETDTGKSRKEGVNKKILAHKKKCTKEERQKERRKKTNLIKTKKHKLTKLN